MARAGLKTDINSNINSTERILDKHKNGANNHWINTIKQFLYYIKQNVKEAFKKERRIFTRRRGDRRQHERRA